jgi:hypothetical protein
MNFAIVTMHDSNYSELADITFNQNKQPYCLRHGYQLFAKTDNFSPGNSKYFDKFRYLLEVMQAHSEVSWCWWLDCDAMITNWSVPISRWCNNQYHLVISVDRYNLNNGSFFIRNSQQGRDYLQHILSLEDQYLTARWPDQQPMIDLTEQYQSIMYLHPQRDFNSYDYDFYHRDHGNTEDCDLFGHSGNWIPGDFVCHYPGIQLKTRIELATMIKDKIVL